MKHRVMAIPFLLGAAFLLARLGARERAVSSDTDIPRFQLVAKGLYRGGQPTPAGFEFLKQKGIKTVVDLRAEDEEQALVEKLGMKYIKLPVNVWEPIPEETVESFFRVVRDPASQPVFVHCRRGADRVGVMVGFYRIAFQGWDGNRTYQEARALGMRWWYRGLKRQLYEFAAKQAMQRGRRSQD